MNTEAKAILYILSGILLIFLLVMAGHWIDKVWIPELQPDLPCIESEGPCRHPRHRVDFIDNRMVCRCAW